MGGTRSLTVSRDQPTNRKRRKKPAGAAAAPPSPLHLCRSLRRWLCMRTPEAVCSIPPIMLLTSGTLCEPLTTIFPRWLLGYVSLGSWLSTVGWRRRPSLAAGHSNSGESSFTCHTRNSQRRTLWTASRQNNVKMMHRRAESDAIVHSFLWRQPHTCLFCAFIFNC